MCFMKSWPERESPRSGLTPTPMSVRVDCLSYGAPSVGTSRLAAVRGWPVPLSANSGLGQQVEGGVWSLDGGQPRPSCALPPRLPGRRWSADVGSNGADARSCVHRG